MSSPIMGTSECANFDGKSLCVCHIQRMQKKNMLKNVLSMMPITKMPKMNCRASAQIAATMRNPHPRGRTIAMTSLYNETRGQMSAGLFQPFLKVNDAIFTGPECGVITTRAPWPSTAREASQLSPCTVASILPPPAVPETVPRFS